LKVETQPPLYQPWLKNRRWKSGRIRDQSSKFVFFSILFSIILNGFACLVMVSVFQDHAAGNALFIFPVILIIAGAAMLAWTIRQIMVRVKFGRSVFELETLPGVIGGYLAGTIRAPVILDAAKGVKLELECCQIAHGRDFTGKTTAPREETLLTARQTLGHDLPHDGRCTCIPVSFEIPANAKPSGYGGPSSIFWRLRARAAMSGADYDASFIVPVYQVPNAANVPPKAEALAAAIRGSKSRRRTSDAELTGT
jgi:hypothetical protein